MCTLHLAKLWISVGFKVLSDLLDLYETFQAILFDKKICGIDPHAGHATKWNHDPYD